MSVEEVFLDLVGCRWLEVKIIQTFIVQFALNLDLVNVWRHSTTHNNILLLYLHTVKNKVHYHKQN